MNGELLGQRLLRQSLGSGSGLACTLPATGLGADFSIGTGTKVLLISPGEDGKKPDLAVKPGNSQRFAIRRAGQSIDACLRHRDLPNALAVINPEGLHLSLAIQAAPGEAKHAVVIEADRKDSANDCLEFPDLIRVPTPAGAALTLDEKLCLAIGFSDKKFVFLRMNGNGALAPT